MSGAKDDWICLADECRLKTLSLLDEISTSIAESANLKQTLIALLRTMQQHMRIVRGAVSLYDRNTGSIYVHESIELTEEEESRGICRFGEGITGQVVESGKAMIIPRVTD